MILKFARMIRMLGSAAALATVISSDLFDEQWFFRPVPPVVQARTAARSPAYTNPLSG
jgi:hypothetical protein